MVMVVVAVRGLSFDAPDIASWDDGGSFPVSSSFRMRDFRSSSSSHTVDGAVVDNVDSVPSTRDLSGSARARSVTSELDGCRLLRIVERVVFRCMRESCMEDRRSPLTGGERGEVSGLVRLSRLRGALMVDRGPEATLE